MLLSNVLIWMDRWAPIFVKRFRQLQNASTHLDKMRFKMKKMFILSSTVLSLLATNANAGLFDELKKVQGELEALSKAPSEGSSDSGIPSLNGMKLPGLGGSAAPSPSVGSSANASAAANDIESICGAWTKGRIDGARALKSLPGGNVSVLAADFSLPISDIDKTLANELRSDEKNPDVMSLELYNNAFETSVMNSFFSQFLGSAEKAKMLSIIKQTADAKAGFSAEKKKLKRDAQQAYGIALMYYANRGAKKENGMAYLRAASKSSAQETVIASYQRGHRAYFGIGEKRDLSKAATWMLKAYETIKERRRTGNSAAYQISDEFWQLVNGEFMNIVAEPNYARRQMYADLIAAEKSQRASAMSSLQSSGGASPDTRLIVSAYLIKKSRIKSKVFGSIGDENKQTIEQDRLKMFEQQIAADKQKNPEEFVMTDKTSDRELYAALESVKALDGSQKKIFNDATVEVANLTNEMKNVTTGMLAKFMGGSISVAQMDEAGPVWGSVKESCAMFDKLSAVLVKVGAPSVKVEFSEDTNAENSVVTLANNFDS